MSEERDDEIGALLREAGRRPPIPAEDLAAIRAAARAAWCAAVRRSRARALLRRGAFALAASVVLALVVGAWWLLGRAPDAPAVVATVELHTGDVRVPGTDAAIGVGAMLREGATLITGAGADDAPARVALRLAGGPSIRVDAGSRVRLVAATRIALELGAVYVDSGSLAGPGAAIDVVTPFGVVREIGTQFEVRLPAEADRVRVRVREGRVGVQRDGASHTGVRGEELTLSRDGSLARGAVEPDGPEWQWVLAAAPPFEIEGRSLRSYLDWVARESGWRVEYADAELERAAGAIVLHGTIEALRPDESIAAVVAGSGLDHRVGPGRLRIERRPGAGVRTGR